MIASIPPAVPLLVERLGDAPEIARASAEALGRVGSVDALPALVRLIKEPKTERQLLRKAFWAVGSIGDKAAGPALVPHLRHADAEIAGWAAEALGRIKAIDATRALIGALEREEAPLRQMVAWALTEIYGQNMGEDSDRWWQWISASEEREAAAEE